MARISLLFSLALVLAIGSVLAHPPTHKKTQKTLSIFTLSKLQSYPYNEISKFVEKQAQSAPNKIQFKKLFATCKGFTEYLGSVKYTGSKEEVVNASYAKLSMFTKELVAAQRQVGVGLLSAKLSHSYAVMAERYVRLVGRIAAISMEYKFNANAKISKTEKVEIEKAVFKLKGSIRVYVKVITKCTKKFSVGKNIDFPFTPRGGFLGTFAQKSVDADKSYELIGVGRDSKVGREIGFGSSGHAGGKSIGAGKGKAGKIGGSFGFDAAGKVKIGGGRWPVAGGGGDRRLVVVVAGGRQPVVVVMVAGGGRR
ncbi:hypothetical protein CARUB_v10018676mg [Capsella rubella]|uniref:DUF1216 domain-containing protein n=1 Tax=Capsella rubella TaxID=81985 RepID=R0HN55_9BRAS|nr:hypothetical protein CARUB_v10018676mg [Capsella rubella]